MRLPRTGGAALGVITRGRLRPAGALALAVAAMAATACSPTDERSAGAVSAVSPSPRVPTDIVTLASPAPRPSPLVSATGGRYELGRYLPLWPFASVAEARAWQREYRSAGHAPWHLSAEQTALSFVRSLGLKGIDRTTTRTVGDADARVGVGYKGPEGTATAAVIHLIRLGEGRDVPWEVVGSEDKDLSLTTPEYGATVTSPVTVGGSVTGVDESLHVLVVQRSTGPEPIGSFCCASAGGMPGRWSAKVSFRRPTDPVLTIVVYTGGHVAEVERFAVTGVRAG